jgi:DNA-binding FadR family transcriptional regulator
MPAATEEHAAIVSELRGFDPDRLRMAVHRHIDHVAARLGGLGVAHP